MTPVEQAASKIRLGLSIIDEDTRLGELTDTEIEWLAKVVIVALREPSEAMLGAGMMGLSNSGVDDANSGDATSSGRP